MNQKQAADHPPRLHIPCDEFIQKKKEDRLEMGCYTSDIIHDSKAHEIFEQILEGFCTARQTFMS